MSKSHYVGVKGKAEANACAPVLSGGPGAGCMRKAGLFGGECLGAEDPSARGSSKLCSPYRTASGNRHTLLPTSQIHFPQVQKGEGRRGGKFQGAHTPKHLGTRRTARRPHTSAIQDPGQAEVLL